MGRIELKKKNKKNIKILLAFHKPYPLIKSDLFVPVHVGRDIAFEKSKDGTISDKDYNWLLKNTVGDNTGDNISAKNRSYCEITATYWAWKNYDKLGNPDYIGLMHYRTFFNLKNIAKKMKLKSWCESFYYNQDFIEKIMEVSDGVISRPLNINELHKACNIPNAEIAEKEVSEEMFYFVDKEFTHLAPIVEYFLESRMVYFKNMFILKKEDFMEYCELLFGVIDRINRDKNIVEKPRLIGYYAEKISSIIFDYFKITKKRNFLEADWLIIPEKRTSKMLRKQYFKDIFAKITKIFTR